MLTTHFIKICSNLETNKSISNCKMKTTNENNKIQYNYKLLKGISDIKGGMHILEEMNYPKEITKIREN